MLNKKFSFAFWTVGTFRNVCLNEARLGTEWLVQCKAVKPRSGSSWPQSRNPGQEMTSMTRKFSSDCRQPILVIPEQNPYQSLRFERWRAVFMHSNADGVFLWEGGFAFLHDVVYFESYSDVDCSLVFESNYCGCPKDLWDSYSKCETKSDSSSQRKKIW